MIERLNLIKDAGKILRDQHLLIAAAAGYGKSILLRQLLAYLPGAAYIPLSVADNDLTVLQPRVAAHESGFVLLDDVHLLEQEGTTAVWLRDLLAEDARTFVFAGRQMPFSTTPLLATGAAVLWDAEPMRFTINETRQLLGQDAAKWHETLAGWPLGAGLLRLLPPTQRRPDAAQEQLFSYLANSVLAGLPSDLRHFLAVTAAPETFSIPLAAHLLGVAETEAAEQLQGILRHNLFVSAATEPDWYRYHDLFRAFVRSQDSEATVRWQLAAADWHLAHKAPIAAIDHLLLAGDQQAALVNMTDQKQALLGEQGRLLTYRRWIRQIDEPLLVKHVDLVVDYTARLQYENQYRGEPGQLLQKLSADKTLTAEDRQKVAFQRANLHRVDNEHDAAIAILKPIIEAKELDPDRHNVACQIVAVCRAEQMKPRQSRRYFKMALATPELSPFRIRNTRANMAQTALAKLGRYAEAFATFDEIVEEEPNAHWQLRYLLQSVVVASQCGAVEKLGAALDGLAQVINSVEHVATSDKNWFRQFSLIHQALLNPGRPLDDCGEDLWGLAGASSRVWAMSLAVTLGRLTGDADYLDGILTPAAAAAHDVEPHGFERATIALEVDIARGLRFYAGQRADVALSPMTKTLIEARCQGELVRLQALLALVGYRQRDPRWRRRVAQVLRNQDRPHYEGVLTRRDPQLGASFWALLLAERMATDRAQEALVTIGFIDPLLPLLDHPSTAVRLQTADILAAIGDERAMGPLQEAIKTTAEKPVRQGLRAALTRLERRPPPRLQISLLGGFRVQRGGEEIGDFHRPIVARLLQYFAVQRGRTIPRDQILEDIWPDTPPKKAAVTLRTVYSRLRVTLEPHMRSKGPNRYFSLDGDSMTFDPLGYVTTDVETFEQTVRAGLAGSEPLGDGVLAALEAYAPLLPELPYADWLLEARARLEELYLAGCLRAGQEALAGREAAQAQRWAQRVLRDAPWMEAGYQLLMRAYARQEQRSRALRTYEQARAALRAELAVDPAPLTEWLRQRLEAGEPI